MILRWRGDTSIWESLYIAPGGFGTGIILATTFVALAAGVDDAQMAIAGTGIYLSVNIGGLVGTSLASNVLHTTLETGLYTGLKDIPNRQTVCLNNLSAFKILADNDLSVQIIENALSDLDYVKGLNGPVRDIVIDAYVHSFEYTHCEHLHAFFGTKV